MTNETLSGKGTATSAQSTDLMWLARGETDRGITPPNFRGYVDVKDYGALGDGITDDTSALNTAFNFASNNGKSVYIPAGVYVISSTLQATVHGSTFQTCHIVGAGQGNATGDASWQTTVIDATALVDVPAINIYKARSAYLGYFMVQGSAKDIETDFAAYGAMRYDSAWVTSGYRDSRYSPHCGISIDAGVGSTPADGGYSGMTYEGSTSGTLGFHLDHINIRRFVVGVMHNPETDAQQGDLWRLTHPIITSTKVAIACGQAQARAGTIDGGLLWWCRTAYDGLEYGQQQGSTPAFINTEFVVLFEMFSNAGGQERLNAIGCRAEEVHRIGESVGGTTTGLPTTFDGVDVHLLDPALNAQSRCPVVFDGGNSPLIWTGGYLGEGQLSGIGENFGILADNAKLDSVMISVANRFQPYVGGLQDLNSPVKLVDCRVRDDTAAIRYGETVRRFSVSGRVSEHQSPSRRVIGTSIYEYIPKNANNYTNIGTKSSISFTATTLIFDNSDPAGIQVADLIIWRFNAVGKSAVKHLLPAAKVTGIVTNTVTCDLLYPRAYYDETYLGAGGLTQVVQRMWAPGEALTGDTNTSTSLTNVSPTTILKNGDWITTSTGIPTSTRVVSGEGTATITLSRAATDTAAGKALYWDRLHTADTTVAF